MQVTQIRAEGLKREFKIVVPAADLAARAEAQLSEMKDRVRINGFRPGKVPLAHVRRLYGRSVMADIVNNMVGEANKKIVDDNAIKLAMEPKLDFEGGDDGVKSVIEGNADFAWTVSVEVVPAFEIGDLSDIAIERPKADVPDADVQTALENLARRNVSYSEKTGKSAASAKFDRVTVDFVGTINGEPFEGGEGTDIVVDLGSNTFIPGFEDQLIGVKAGQDKTVDVTFPGNYLNSKLAGQKASFAVKVKKIEAPGELTIDDELAKSVGLEDLEKLKDAMRSNFARELDVVSRRKVKRQLLDALDTRFTFELPPTLVEQEFDSVWRQVRADMEAANRTFEDEKTTEEEAKAEYHRIAERRVRLGLVLAEIGEKAGVQVTDDEVTRAVVDRARQFPGQEQQVWEFYRKNPGAIAQLRAPIFEDKVVDHILGIVKVTETTVSKDDLLKEDDEDNA
ncbi:MAG: trigger factor [Labrys sp. (in: a-proteobacteria)]|jgi:trigger factor